MSDEKDLSDLSDRVSRLEGVVDTEDKTLEREVSHQSHVQALILGVVGLMVAAGVAMLVYVLQRLDTLSLMVKHG